MEPTLAAGEWLLVDPHAYCYCPPAVGELVVAADPWTSDRPLIKRVRATNTDGTLRLAGDHPAHGDETELAAVAPESLLGRPWFRYAPVNRLGRVR